MIQHFLWSVSAWDGWGEKRIVGEGTDFVLLGFLFSAGVISLQCCNAINFSHLNRDLL